MRVACSSIDEFCRELIFDAKHVCNLVVRFQINYLPEQKEDISRSVFVTASTMISTDLVDYVLEFVGDAGIDGPGDLSTGTERAMKYRELILSACDKHGLCLRGGRIDA